MILKLSFDYGMIESKCIKTISAACTFLALSSIAAVAEGVSIDVTSPPRGLLTAKKTQAQWNAYKKAKACFEHPVYARGRAIKVGPLDAEMAAKVEFNGVFGSGESAEGCNTAEAVYGSLQRPPEPIVSINLDEAYGEQQHVTERAIKWFAWAAAAARFDPDSEYPQSLKITLLEWAQADALKKGVNVSWGDKPVDWQHICLILAILHASESIADRLSEEDKRALLPWLADLVANVGRSRWKDRQDNKAYQVAYSVGLWAALTGDRRLLQEVADVYKLAIHDMRPDGSMPIDTQRGGMGLTYNADSVGTLVLIALLLQRQGADLFGYSVEGRSIHTGVEFVVAGVEDPSLNARYAIKCPDGGDRWGTIKEPSLFYAEGNDDVLGVSPMLAYANLFPDKAVSARIHRIYKSKQQSPLIYEVTGSIPVCLFPGR